MSQINSKIKDDFQVVLLLSCFVGHPVYSSVWSAVYLPDYLLILTRMYSSRLIVNIQGPVASAKIM